MKNQDNLITNQLPGTYYEFVVKGPNGEKLAYKEKDKDWVINDPIKAIEQCFQSIKTLNEMMAEVERENTQLKVGLVNMGIKM